MKYVSTRGTAPVLTFDDVLLTGLASDGGLYVPEAWPSMPTLPAPDAGYAELAAAVMWPFVEGVLDRRAFTALVEDAYAGFDRPEVCPLVPLGADVWLLELFHGPTLAFKDLALQVVGRLFDAVLAERDERLTVLVATSGDTGSAAIEACRGRERLDIVVLFPDGRVSEVQRRMMTTVDAPNVRCVAVDGTFDDCQDLVKAVFGDLDFRRRHRLTAMNSINWARVPPQVAYYVAAARAVGDRVDFAVPTGNFGNVLAGWTAAQMGLAVERLIIGSNRNDILPRWIESGRMEVAEVHSTTSPSIDIQVSSNVERLLFELYDRDGAAVAAHMAEFRETGRLDVGPDRLARLQARFVGTRLGEGEVAEVMRSTHERTGVLVDPHTAVGLGAAERRTGGDSPVVVLATASPAKFPDAVEAATGVRPPLPDRLAGLLDAPERVHRAPNDLDAVRDLIATGR